VQQGLEEMPQPAAERLGGEEVSLTAAFGDEFSNGWNKFVGNLHHRLSLVLRSGFVFGDSLFLSLPFVMRQHATDSGLIPTRREVTLCGHRCFLRRRR